MCWNALMGRVHLGRFFYYEPDTLPNLSERKEASPPESLNSPTVTELQPESQSEGPQSQSKATELPQEKIKSDGPESQTMGPELDEINETHSKSKEPVLARYIKRHHALDQIIGDKSNGKMTRRKLKGICLLAEFEPRNIKGALDNESWVEEMNEEIEQIEKNKTQTLVPRPQDKNVIGIEFQNKLNEDGKVSKNKAKLVCKGYSQEKGIDYG